MPDCGSGSFWFESRYLPFYMWKLKYTKHYNTNLNKITLLSSLIYIFLKNKNINYTIIPSLTKIMLLTKYNTVSTSNLKKLNYSRTFLKSPTYGIKNSPINLNLRSNWKKQLVTTFLNVNTWLPTRTLDVHQSFLSLYYYNHQSNIGIFNMKKLFNVWLNILNFLNNIFIFNINYLFFTSSYFKYENLSINWAKNKALKSLWRYTNPFIFFLNNKTTLHNDIYFKFLSKKVSKVSVLVDIFYHKRTLHYFKKYKFITLGPVPISSNFYTLTLSFPVSSNSVFSNLFFIRMFLRMGKLVSNSKFQNYRNL